MNTKLIIGILVVIVVGAAAWALLGRSTAVQPVAAPLEEVIVTRPSAQAVPNTFSVMTPEEKAAADQAALAAAAATTTATSSATTTSVVSPEGESVESN